MGQMGRGIALFLCCTLTFSEISAANGTPSVSSAYQPAFTDQALTARFFSSRLYIKGSNLVQLFMERVLLGAGKQNNRLNASVLLPVASTLFTYAKAASLPSLAIASGALFLTTSLALGILAITQIAAPATDGHSDQKPFQALVHFLNALNQEDKTGAQRVEWEAAKQELTQMGMPPSALTQMQAVELTAISRTRLRNAEERNPVDLQDFLESLNQLCLIPHGYAVWVDPYPDLAQPNPVRVIRLLASADQTMVIPVQAPVTHFVKSFRSLVAASVEVGPPFKQAVTFLPGLGVVTDVAQLQALHESMGENTETIASALMAASLSEGTAYELGRSMYGSMPFMNQSLLYESPLTRGLPGPLVAFNQTIARGHSDFMRTFLTEAPRLQGQAYAAAAHVFGWLCALANSEDATPTLTYLIQTSQPGQTDVLLLLQLLNEQLNFHPTPINTETTLYPGMVHPLNTLDIQEASTRILSNEFSARARLTSNGVQLELPLGIRSVFHEAVVQEHFFDRPIYIPNFVLNSVKRSVIAYLNLLIPDVQRMLKPSFTELNTAIEKMLSHPSRTHRELIDLHERYGYFLRQIQSAYQQPLFFKEGVDPESITRASARMNRYVSDPGESLLSYFPSYLSLNRGHVGGVMTTDGDLYLPGDSTWRWTRLHDAQRTPLSWEEMDQVYGFLIFPVFMHDRWVARITKQTLRFMDDLKNNLAFNFPNRKGKKDDQLSQEVQALRDANWEVMGLTSTEGESLLEAWGIDRGDTIWVENDTLWAETLALYGRSVFFSTNKKLTEEKLKHIHAKSAQYILSAGGNLQIVELDPHPTPWLSYLKARGGIDHVFHIEEPVDGFVSNRIAPLVRKSLITGPAQTPHHWILSDEPLKQRGLFADLSFGSLPVSDGISFRKGFWRRYITPFFAAMGALIGIFVLTASSLLGFVAMSARDAAVFTQPIHRSA